MVRMSSEATFEDVLVLIPALNEETSIARTISSVRAILPGAKILVIDNASTDKTSQVAVEEKAISVVELQRGKGFAVRRGFRSVTDSIKVVAMLDGDDTYGCEKLPIAVDAVRNLGVDMVVGTRIEADVESHRKPAYKAGHTLGNSFFSKFSAFLHPVGIEDSLSGWRVMSRGFVKSFAGGATGFEIEAELNAHAYIIHASVMNVPVAYKGRLQGSHSKLNTYRDGFRILRMNLILFRNNRPQLAFGLLSVPWFVSSAILVSHALLTYFRTGLVKQFPSLIAGVGAFIVGALLVIAGIILQRVKLIRATLALYNFGR